ncbi:MAG: GspH/FimT family protein [Candidatus Obscuribacterales bacterium]|nr:GspH/FimT family protein [Steroidobacteraceae bacterium]
MAGILASIAIPGFAQLQRNSARTSAVNDFVHTVFLARSEAIKRGLVVSICRSVNGERCDNRAARWDTGWLVFINRDRDQPADLDVGEEILHRNGGWAGGKITSNRLSFSFRPASQADVNGTIVFCHPRSKASDARAVIISHTGRPRVATRDASGRALACG